MSSNPFAATRLVLEHQRQLNRRLRAIELAHPQSGERLVAVREPTPAGDGKGLALGGRPERPGTGPLGDLLRASHVVRVRQHDPGGPAELGEVPFVVGRERQEIDENVAGWACSTGTR
jgi:hypothetical protein